MSRHRHLCTAILLLSMVVGLSVATVNADISPVGTTFTYQGRLFQSGEPVSGTLDLMFRLYSTAGGGVPLEGGVLVANDFEIGEDGFFTLDLDFDDLFTGEPRWLEIVVNETALSPRQPIVAVPHVMVATTAANAPAKAVVGVFSGITGVGTLNTLNVSGNVGVGTTDPQSRLHIVGAESDGQEAAVRIVSGSETMLMDGNEIDSTDQSSLLLNSNTQHNVILATGGGKVGVGTGSPQARLDVVANTAEGNDYAARFTALDIGPNQSFILTENLGDWRIRSASSEGKVIFQNGGGNVGIGLSNPQYRLHVADGSDHAIRGDSFGTGSAAPVYGQAGSSSGVIGMAAATFGVCNGVLGESNSVAGRGVYGFASSSTGSNYGVFGTSLSSEGRGVAGLVTTWGATGVYGQSPGGRGVYGLVTAQSGVNYAVYGESQSNIGYDFYAAGDGLNYGAPSSRRWKSNIRNVDEPLDKLAQLRGVQFTWDAAHGGHQDIGFIAEDVGKVLPEIVQYEENGVDAVGMDYSMLSPLLVEAVNALRNEKNAALPALNAEVVTLEERLQRLEEIVAGRAVR